MADCQTMAEMAESTLLRISLIINLLIAIVSIPIFVYAFVYLMNQKLFHRNTSIQIQVHICGLVVHSVGRIGLHSFDLHNYFSNFDNGCEILPDFYRCFITRGLYNVGLSMVQVCSIPLAIERIIAFMRNKTYEHSTILIGITLGALQLFLCFCFLFNLYYYAPFKPSNEIVQYYCQTLASGKGSVWTINAPLYATMISQIICRTIFHILSKKSRNLRISSKSMNLSSKYNLKQGRCSIRVLKIFVNVNTFVFAFLSVVETTLHFNSSKFSRPTYFALVEFVHLYPSYGILLSLYLFWTLKKMDQSSDAEFARVMKTNPDHYFQLFNKQLK